MDELSATAYDIKAMTGRTARLLGLFVLALITARATNAQRVRGELRMEVRDPQGAPVPTQAELVSEGNQFRRTFQVDADGHYVVHLGGLSSPSDWSRWRPDRKTVKESIQ